MVWYHTIPTRYATRPLAIKHCFCFTLQPSLVASLHETQIVRILGLLQQFAQPVVQGLFLLAGNDGRTRAKVPEDQVGILVDAVHELSLHFLRLAVGFGNGFRVKGRQVVTQEQFQRRVHNVAARRDGGGRFGHGR